MPEDVASPFSLSARTGWQFSLLDRNQRLAVGLPLLSPSVLGEETRVFAIYGSLSNPICQCAPKRTTAALNTALFLSAPVAVPSSAR